MAWLDWHPMRQKPPAGATEDELESHPHWRRFSKRYRAKKAFVRDAWIGGGLVIACLPGPAQAVALVTLVFLSLSILDEEP